MGVASYKPNTIYKLKTYRHRKLHSFFLDIDSSRAKPNAFDISTNTYTSYTYIDYYALGDIATYKSVCSAINQNIIPN